MLRSGPHSDAVRLSPEALREFKELYETEFGERLSDTEAEQAGLRLLRLFDILASHAGNDGSTAAPAVTIPRGTLKRGKVR